jgi:AT-rich DNA-binding protein
MFMAREDVSRLTITRLVLYHSVLKMMKADGMSICVSSELGRRTGISPDLIRRDLASFGEFGTKGVGYQVCYLLRRIEEILGYDTAWNTVVVGLDMPTVVPVMCYPHFWPSTVRILAVIDLAKQKRGTVINKLKLRVESIENIKDIVSSRNITIGIVILPPPYAQKTVDQLVQAGIRGIVNLSSFPVFVPDHTVCIQVNLASWFAELTFSLTCCRQQAITESY